MPKQTFKQKIDAQIKKYDLDKQKLPNSVKKIVGKTFKQTFKQLNPESIKYYKYTKSAKSGDLGGGASTLYSRIGTQGDWTDEGQGTYVGVTNKLGMGKWDKDRKTMTWKDTRVAKANEDYITKKFKVKNPNNPIIIDPIPIDNRQGLKLMGKIPYRTGGVQARPEELLGQIDLRMFDMDGTNLAKPRPKASFLSYRSDTTDDELEEVD
tara:strand:+ start:100 stop:726 length:627 start_codon:yes stop_codon:yes gene_type:complete